MLYFLYLTPVKFPSIKTKGILVPLPLTPPQNITFLWLGDWAKKKPGGRPARSTLYWTQFLQAKLPKLQKQQNGFTSFQENIYVKKLAILQAKVNPIFELSSMTDLKGINTKIIFI
jgi:hypothetical protein